LGFLVSKNAKTKTENSFPVSESAKKKLRLCAASHTNIEKKEGKQKEKRKIKRKHYRLCSASHTNIEEKKRKK